MKYKIIYADPAWKYNNKPNKNGRTVESHYPTMEPEAIKNLPINSIADNNSILFIWVTFPKLIEGLDVIKAWGFNYKTIGFVWIKTNKNTSIKQFSFLPQDNFDTFMGMGNYTRSNAEICLIATKGTVKRLRADINSIIYSPIQKHSKKPSIVRNLIIQLVGDLPKVELFAREKIIGWDSWGNEIKDSIIF